MSRKEEIPSDDRLRDRTDNKGSTLTCEDLRASNGTVQVLQVDCSDTMGKSPTERSSLVGRPSVFVHSSRVNPLARSGASEGQIEVTVYLLRAH